MNFSQRNHTKELLDGDDIPFDDIRQNMKELNTINTLLGGHAITIDGFRKVLGAKTTATVCEIGCGGGDNLQAIARFCNSHNIQISCIGIDIKPACIEYARQRWQFSQPSVWLTDDYRHATFETRPDIIFSSLFCHHFTQGELVEQVQWMQRHAALGFFINDLQRHVLAYRSIQLLTGLFSSSYLVKNDAPLSVARGFSRSDWVEIFDRAGIQHFDLRWKWAFRYLVTCKHEQN